MGQSVALYYNISLHKNIDCPEFSLSSLSLPVLAEITASRLKRLCFPSPTMTPNIHYPPKIPETAFYVSIKFK